jgi:FkbM family methyltransferase
MAPKPPAAQTAKSSTTEESGTVETNRAEFTAFGQHVRVEGRDPAEYVFRRIRTTQNFYESGLLDALSYLPLAADSVVVDAGANLGNHSLFFAMVLGRRVLSIEPEPGNHDLLLRNIALNGVGDRVTPYRCALGRTAGTTSLEQRIAGNAGTYHTLPGGSGDIEVRTLDDLVGAGTRVSLIKVDVEGDELAVLEGAREILTRDRPFVCLEIHSGALFRDVAAFLAEFGYRAVDVLGLSDNYLYGHDASCGPQGLDEVVAVARLRAERTRQRDVMGSLARLSNGVNELRAAADTPGPASRQAVPQASPDVTSSRRSAGTGGSEATQLMPQPQPQPKPQPKVASKTAPTGDVDPQEREKARLERRVALWEEAYAGLATSRPMQWAQAARRLAGRPRARMAPEDRAARIEKVLRREFPPVKRLPQKPAPLRGQVPSRPYAGNAVRVGIASIPSRVDGLEEVVSRLYDQVDDIRVYLNGFTEIPSFLTGDPKIEAVLGPDLADRGKFAFLDGFDGYYFTADDDIAYPPFYVEHCIDGIERYGRKAAVSWHGSLLRDPFEDYYDPDYRRVLSFRAERKVDVPAHILGTGCTAFHTDTIRPSLADFAAPNMADVFFALHAQREQVPLVVLNHRKGWATPLELEDTSSISGDSIAQSQSRLNVRLETNRRVNEHGPWTIHKAAQVVQREPLSVGLIGRIDGTLWRKGGIVKSAHLTAEMLAPLGVDVQLFDLRSEHLYDLGGFEPDLLIVYPGDPERPDFADVISVVEHHAGLGRVVAVNMSLNMQPERTQHIAERLSDWNERFPGLVHLLVFSDRVRDLPELRKFSDQLFTMPKTLAIDRNSPADFHETDGVFVGDIGKLCDARLVDEPVEEWLDAIRAALPGVPLYAVAQYIPKEPKDLGVEILPYLTEHFAARLSRMRLMVSPFRYCTFEMVPMELAGLGVPVVYKTMEQSLSDYLGLGGVEVRGPGDLETVLPSLYHDPTVWRGVSSSGASIAAGLDRRRLAGQMYLRLLGLRAHARRLQQASATH